MHLGTAKSLSIPGGAVPPEGGALLMAAILEMMLLPCIAPVYFAHTVSFTSACGCHCLRVSSSSKSQAESQVETGGSSARLPNVWPAGLSW